MHPSVEPRRKALHAAVALPVIVAFALIPVAPLLVRGALVVVALVAVAIDRLRERNPALSDGIDRLAGPLLRPDERRGLTGATTWAIAAAGAFLLFTPVVALAALLDLAVGDAAASLVGGRWGRTRIGAGASLEGCAACLAACCAATLPLVFIDRAATPAVTLCGAAAATIVEAVTPGRWDNIALPLAAGSAMTIAIGLL